MCFTDVTLHQEYYLQKHVLMVSMVLSYYQIIGILDITISTIRIAIVLHIVVIHFLHLNGQT